MQRRTFMNQLPAGVAGAGLAACGSGSAGGTGSKPTFVFIHGAWHGGWCWSEVVRLLAEHGYPALALDLPGHGITARFPAAYLSQDAAALSSEPSPLAALGLNDYREHTLKVIRGLTQDGSGPVILVGHSLGGATLSAVAEAAPQLVRRLVYLTAFVPVAFQTVLEYLMQPNFASSEVPSLFVADPRVAAAARINHNSADMGYVAKCRSAFYHDVSDAVFPVIANLLTPDEPIQAFTTPVGATAARWGSVQRAFIRCTSDRAIPITLQDKMIADADALTPGNAFVQKTLATSHSPFASNPSALVEALVSLA